jgi:hypothetical protein
MPSTELLCQIIGIDPHKLSNEENLIVEVELFTRVCEELKYIFKVQYKSYFRLIKCDAEMENAIMEAKFVRCVINDILSTEEYTLPGIACYTQTPEEVVYEVATGLNTSPSATLLRRIIELHRSIRQDLYHEIIKKITTEYLAAG